MISSNARLEQQLRFVLELDKAKNVFRQTHLSHHGRRENDAEHSWHMAVMALALGEYANENVDIAHVMMLCLIHDVVEIDAGDTYAYDSEAEISQPEREEKAADRIFGLLPSDMQQRFRQLFDEFQAAETPEAKFARAMDNFQPLLLNDSNDGGDWVEHHVTRKQVDKRHKMTALGSKRLYKKSVEILDANEAAGHFAKETDEGAGQFVRKTNEGVSPFVIEPAQPEDIPAIMELLSQVLEVHAQLRPDVFIPGTAKYTPVELQSIIENEDTPIFVARRENAHVDGYIFCVIKEPPFTNTMKKQKTLFVDDLCVAELAKGSGAANKLLQHAIDFGREIGCYNVTLNVWEGNERARRFYEKQGMFVRESQMEMIL